MTSARDRAGGALVGLAFGDAVGTTLEFQRPASSSRSPTWSAAGRSACRPGEWTDDTSMALCLAESLLDRGCLDLEDQLRRYVLWHRDGYLRRTGAASTSAPPPRASSRGSSGPAKPSTRGPTRSAAANGSLMRLGPVPIRWHADPADRGRALRRVQSHHARGDAAGRRLPALGRHDQRR